MRKQFNKIKIFASCLMVLCVLGVTSIGSYAAVNTGSTSSISVTYNNSERGLCYGNTYLPWNWNSDTTMDHENTDSESVFWYKGKNLSLFTSSADFYGYQVQVTRTSNTVNTFENAQQKFWCIGTAGQLMNGENRGGVISSSSFTAWVPTNNSVQTVHMAPMYQFTYAFDLDWEGALDDADDLVAYDYWGSYEINAKYTVKYTGYKTVADYTTAMNNILAELQDQTGELGDINQGISDLDKTVDDGLGEVDDSINDGFDNAVNGFDTADGDAMNNQLDNTLKDYGTAEDSLFVSAKNGLDSFEFAEIKDYPSLVTAMSLVSSLMSSALIALGGTDSAASLVLAILFTIMLVSMAIGLYHFYQGKKGG